MNLLLQILAASLLGGALSLLIAALLTFGLSRRWLTGMVSFSAGVLLATALLDLLPEALEGGFAAKSLFSCLLAGLLGFFLLERTALWRHRHEVPPAKVPSGPLLAVAKAPAADDARAVGSAAPMILIGDAVHNLTDGAVLAAAFLADTRVGWITALAVIAHEIPHEAGAFALLLAAGWSKAKALVWNAISGLTSVLGAVIGYYSLAGTRAWVPPILTIAAASFLYIAVADLMPWLLRQRGTFAWHGAFMAAGVTLVPLGIHLLH